MSEPKLIWHGSYANGTVYGIVQHRYGSTDCESSRQGYVEVLQIKDAPSDKCGSVIHVHFNDTGSLIHEFEYWEDAVAAYRRMSGTFYAEKDAKDKQGYKQTINCEDELPWFYQVDEATREKLRADLNKK